MKEIVCIFIGEFGLNIGIPFWEKFCAEQYIDLSGRKIQLKDQPHESYLAPFFQELSSGQLVPRSIFIDLDQTKINKVKNGHLKNLLNKNNFISGKEDASSLFVIGNSFVYQNREDIFGLINREVEKCNNFQGYLIFTSICGGTGSGVSHYLLSELGGYFQQKSELLNFVEIPSNNLYNNCLEPYNCVFSIEQLTYNYNNTNVLFQNEALYNYCSRQLGIKEPNFEDINKQIVNVASSLMSSIRFGGNQNQDLTEIANNTKPNPYLNMIIPSYHCVQNSLLVDNNQSSIKRLTSTLFDQSNSFVDCRKGISKINKCLFSIRGDVIPKLFYQASQEIILKQKSLFSNKYPENIILDYTQQNINQENPIQSTHNIDGLVLQVNSSLHRVLNLICKKYHKLNSSRAYHFWMYSTYGLDKDFRRNSGQNMERYVKDYKNLEVDQVESDQDSQDDNDNEEEQIP